MKIKNKLTVTRVEEEEGQWGKEGEGSRQGTCIKDLWTKTSGGEGLNVGRGGGAGDSNGGKWGLLYLNNNQLKKKNTTS